MKCWPTFLSQSQIIGFEVVDAQRLDYEYKASNFEALTDQSKFDVDFATSPDLIYWPFNGEFWADELGYYNYTEQSSCQITQYQSLIALKYKGIRRHNARIFPLFTPRSRTGYVQYSMGSRR